MEQAGFALSVVIEGLKAEIIKLNRALAGAKDPLAKGVIVKELLEARDVYARAWERFAVIHRMQVAAAAAPPRKVETKSKH